MGFAMADAFAELGAEVILISGPTNLIPPGSVKKYITVSSSDEMYNQCIKYYPSVDIAVLSAAVADYKPTDISVQKIKSDSENLTINLVKTRDIAKELGQQKSQKQILVGFALETENETQNAKAKLLKKNLDLIVLNSLNDKGAGFGNDTNKISIIDKDNKIHNFGLKSKKDVALDIIKSICEKIKY
jgi:phosphopantothenoylcysteine decarboxylase / phosphopantothenate---cysteine ligase